MTNTRFWTLALCGLACAAACGDRDTAPSPVPPSARERPAQPASEPPQAQVRERVSGREDPQAERAAPADEDALRARDIAAEPERYVGRQVTVQGEVAAVYGTRAFELDGLMAVGSRTVRWLMDDGWAHDTVRARGIVRRGTAAQLERDLRRTFEPEVREALGAEPALVLVAEDVHRLRSDTEQP